MGVIYPVPRTADLAGPFRPASLFPAFASEASSPPLLDFGSTSILWLLRLLALLRRSLLALLPRPQRYAFRRTFMSDAVALLVNAVKAAAVTLRLLADSLEAAADRAASAPLVEVDLRDWDLEDPSELGLGSSAAPPSSSPRASTRFGTAYEQVACSIPPLPAHCLDICGRLGGTQEEVRARAQRAWEAGCWAKACIEGKVQKPRPTPKIPQKAACYIILRGPGIVPPVRVDTAAEYFKLLPQFEDRGIYFSFLPIAGGRQSLLSGGGILLP